jgi:apolipoprotein D and lipocalin family protein
MLKLILCFVILIVVITVRVQSFRCPNIQTKQNFTAEQYMGRWYEIQKYPFLPEFFQKCVTADYTLNSNGTVTVVNRAQFLLTNIPVSITGIATPNATDPARLKVDFYTGVIGDYWVLDTDYTSYSLVYSCVNFFLFRFENAWILSRNTTLDSQTIQNLRTKLSSIGSSTFLLTKTNQRNCNYQ